MIKKKNTTKDQMKTINKSNSNVQDTITYLKQDLDRTLNESMKKYIIFTNNLLGDIRNGLIDKNGIDSIKNHMDRIGDFIDTISNSQNAFNFDHEMLNTLRHNYYYINTYILNRENKDIQEELKNIQKQYQKLKNQLNKALGQAAGLNSRTKKLSQQTEETLDKVNNLSANILTLIVSVSVITTLITAIDKIETVYLPLLVVGTVWLGMVLIMFIANVYKKDTGAIRQNYGLFIIISFLTIIVTIYSGWLAWEREIDISKSNINENRNPVEYN